MEAENARLASELASSRKEASSWHAEAKDAQASLLQARLESQQSGKALEQQRVWMDQSETARRELDEEVRVRRVCMWVVCLHACSRSRECSPLPIQCNNLRQHVKQSLAEARLLRSKVDRGTSDLSRQQKAAEELRKDLAHLEHLHRRDLEELESSRRRATHLQRENERLMEGKGCGSHREREREREREIQPPPYVFQLTQLAIPTGSGDREAKDSLLFEQQCALRE